MQINISWDSSVNSLTGSALTSFESAINAAVQILDQTIQNNITVNINIGYGEVNGSSLAANVSAAGPASYITTTYANLRSTLLAASPGDAADLPASDPAPGLTVAVPIAEAMALGYSQTPGTVDGYAGFGSGFTGTVLDDAALHELTHALGRVTFYNIGFTGSTYATPLEYLRYSAPGTRAFTAGQTGSQFSAAYFSLDGGSTNIASYDTRSDASDWTGTSDPFNWQISSGISPTLSQADLELLRALGYSTGTVTVIDYPAGSNSSSAIVLIGNNIQLQVASGTATQSGVISESGGSFGFAKIGAGTLILTANNTYSGITTITSGTLQIGSGGTTGSLGSGAVLDNAGLAFDRSDSFAVANAISGIGSVTVDGSGTVILTGNNSYSGGTTISGGALTLQTSGTLGAGAVLDDAELTFDFGSFTTIANAISGTGHVTITNFGGLALTGYNTYGGGTTIYEGALIVGNGGTTGSISGDVDVGVATSNSGIVFDHSDNLIFSGDISGLGYVAQEGTGTLTLIGSNSYGSYTSIAGGGTLAIDSPSNLGSGNVQIYGGTLQFNAAMTLSRDFQLNGTASTVIFNTNSNDVVLSGNLTVGNNGSFTKQGAGTLSLTGNGGGPFTISAGLVVVGDGATHGGIASGAAITDNGALGFYRSDAVGIGNVISGTGTVIQLGSGNLTLMANNTYTGETNIAAGRLVLSGSGTIASSAYILDNSIFDISQVSNAIVSLAGSGSVSLGNKTLTITNGTGLVSTGAFTGVIQNGGIAGGTGGSVVITGGVEAFTGANTYTGTTTIAAGASLYIGSASNPTGLLGSGAVIDNGLLGYQLAAPATLANVISGAGSVSQLGAGTLTITGADSYTGHTLIGAGDTLALSGAGSIAASSLVLDEGGTFDISGASSNVSITDLASGGGTSGNVVALGGKTLTISAGAGYVFSGVIQDGGVAGGTGGALTIGGGMSDLTGTNTYTGLTTIASGATLTIGNFTANGSLGSGAVTDNGLLSYALTGPATVSNVISGAGGFIQRGTGNTTLSGTDNYSGATTVTLGTLTVTGSIASSPVTVSPAAATSGTLAGTGTVGATSIQAGGILSPGTGGIGTLHVNGNLTLAAGSSYAADLSGVSADSVTVSGNVSLSGTLAENFGSGSYSTATYTLLTATGTVSGGFSGTSVTNAPAGFYSVISYDTHHAYITLAAIPNISIGNASVTEGGVLQFTVTLDQATARDVTLNYDTFAGTASMANNDYRGGPGTLTIAAGQTTGTISIQTVDNTKNVPSEAMTVHLLSASIGNLTQPIGTGTINNDTVVPNVSIGNASVSEGGVLQFAVTLDQATTRAVTLNYDTFAGTASMANNDYLGGPGTLTIAAGQTTGTISIQTVDNMKNGPSETMTVHLLPTSFGNVTQPIGTGTIVENYVPPPVPNISIGNTSVTEGGVLHFAVTLNQATTKAVTLNYDTFAGTASMADNDYLGGPGTLTILAGQTTGTINIQTVQDTKVEPDETMTVHLLSTSFGNLTQPIGTGTIVNDDVPPVIPNISIGTASVTEGGVLHFGVTLDQATTQNVTLSYDTFAGTASMADNDYLGGPGTLTILAGQTTGTINIQTVQDTKVEPDETMSVHLLTASLGVITQGAGTGTIVNDDVPPVIPNISIGNTSVTEGGVLHFGVTLDQATTQNVTLSYDTFAGTASMANNDYLGGLGTLTIAAGQTTGTINIQTVDNVKNVPSETMTVHLLSTNLGNLTQPVGTGMINNDAVVPNILIGNSSVTEGGVLQFTVTLDRATTKAVTLSYDTFAGTASMANNDYLGGLGTLTIAAGQTTGTINIQTVDNVKNVPSETMAVHLLSTNLGNLTQPIGTGTINNDAVVPNISIGNSSVSEGGVLHFAVTLDQATTKAVTLNYDTFAGTASMADNDYLGGPGLLTIAAGQTTGTINIQTVQDTKVEPDETMTVHLLSTSFGIFSQAVGTGTIINDDMAPNHSETPLAGSPDATSVTSGSLSTGPSSGQFVVDGVAQAANTLIDLTPSQLAQTSFVTGMTSDDLQVRALAGTALSVPNASAWSAFHVAIS